jgi:hypothetical protein
LELNGVISGNLAYSTGIVEGFGSLHSDKDYYAHLMYKLGGLPLDGVMKDGSSLNNPQPYIDNSVSFGAFIYRGNAMIQPDSLGIPQNTFTIFGGDINGYYGRYNLFGGLTLRSDDNPIIGLQQSVNTTAWFAELDITVFPWLLPGIRFESWSSKMPDPLNPAQLISYTDAQIVPGIVALLRPNVKMTLRTRIEKLQNALDATGSPIYQPSPSFEFGQVQLLMTIGI